VILGNQLVKWKWHIWLVTAINLIAFGLALAIAMLLQSLWGVVIVLGCMAFGLYAFYISRHQKRQPRYPLVPPEGKGDIYLPRTDIPRPIYDDFRRMREKKRKFEKIRKMTRKKK